ncbi:aldose 1-epimerase family protein [Frigoribacterium sp. 2-23]|uniref:aldose 1-epimerase family protein n=1 Tax=Frigoribacterium sp. 2-23 TaxID=3415006 RepID=UPI003C701924
MTEHPSPVEASAAAPTSRAAASPTGEQYELVLDEGGHVVTAVVTQVAAGIRSLAVDGASLTESFAADTAPPSACGITLVPWPNRVAQGRWTLDGAVQQLDLTEPSKGNASHGLLRYTAYRPVDLEPHAVTLAATVFPQHGYPFQLDTEVRHELVPDGMVVTHTITNVGPGRAPFAVGSHPFLRVGDHDIATLRVELAAATAFDVDENSIPTGTSPVAGTPRDLRGGAVVGDLDLDTTFRDIDTDAEGARRVTLTAPDGSATEMWGDAAFSYMQVFTPRNFPRGEGQGLAVAAEPMTAPPNALASGEGLLWLDEGATWSASWGIRRRAAA